MDFDYTPQEHSFREEVRGFIASICPRRKSATRPF